MKAPEGKRHSLANALKHNMWVCEHGLMCGNIQLIEPGATETTKVEYNTLRKTFRHLKAKKETGLTYHRLDMKSIRLVVITDASFDIENELRSQLGYLMLMVDATGTANIIHYTSSKCKRLIDPINIRGGIACTRVRI